MKVDIGVERLVVNCVTAAFMVSLSKSSFQELVRLKIAPQPRQLTDGRIGYLVEELKEFAKSRPIANMLPPPNTGAKKPRKAPQDIQIAYQAT